MARQEGQAAAIDRLAGTDGEKLLLRRALDRAAAAERLYTLSALGFLTPAERAFLEKALPYAGVPATFDGGFDGAERTMALWLPEYMTLTEARAEENSPLCVLRLENTAGAVLTHRDYLGSLLGLGIRREALGDIAVDGAQAYLVCTREIAPFLMQNYTKAAAYTLRVTPVPRTELHPRAESGRTVTGTVASLRADAVLALAFRLSREEAKDAFRAGLCARNHTPLDKAETVLEQGDLISLRGRGRARLQEIRGESRKGRTFVTVLVMD